MSIETDIILALCAGVEYAVGIIAPAIPVQYPLITFNRPNNGKYFEVVIIPNDGENETWGEEKTYRGLFRILLHWKIDQSGVVPPTAILANLKPFFAKGKKFNLNNVGVGITDNPTIMSNIGMENEAILPLFMRYANFSTG